MTQCASVQPPAAKSPPFDPPVFYQRFSDVCHLRPRVVFAERTDSMNRGDFSELRYLREGRPGLKQRRRAHDDKARTVRFKWRGLDRPRERLDFPQGRRDDLTVANEADA